MKQTVLKYDVVFEEQPEGGYTVLIPSLPGCITEGDTLEEARKNATEAITVYLESLIKHDEEIPRGDSNVLVEQVAVRNPITQ